MIYEPIEIKDKLGRTVILRTPTPDDADDLIQYLKITSGETPYLIREPEEITLTHDQQVAFIKNCLNSTRSLMLIATIDGKHIGNCSLRSLGDFKRYAHRCEVVIALYENLGFQKYGTLPNNMKYADGTYASTDWMMKKL